MSDMDSSLEVAEKRLPPAAGKGRAKGVPNKTTATLKEAILLAAAEAGEDGDGKGGLQGYLARVAKEDMKAFCALLGKVLPLQLTGDDGGGLQVVIKRYGEARSPHDA